MFQVFNIFPSTLGVLNLTPGAAADITVHIDDEDFVRHINLAFVHVVQHLLGAFGPHLIIARVAKEADANDDIPLQRQTLLRLKELVLETGAAAQGYDFVFAYHGVSYNSFRVYEQLG